MAALKKNITLVLWFAAVVLFSGATTAHSADEEEIGRETDIQIVKRFGLYDNPKVTEYVERVARRTLDKISDREFEFHFKTLDDDMVNAFALPGGYIYVTRGLLATLDSEAALACVIGHEIGHVIGHHSIRQAKKSIGSLLLSLGAMAVSKEARDNAAAWITVTTSISQQTLAGYGREFEIESDQIGMITAHEAGYNPVGMSGFLRTLQRMEQLGGRTYHGFMASHPDTISRIIESEQKSELLLLRKDEVRLYRDRYLSAIAGMDYGKAERRGQTSPPYKIRIHTVKEGETFLSIAEQSVGDGGKGIEIAALNNMDVTEHLTPGKKIKTLVKSEPKDKYIILNERSEDEISPGTGDGESQ